MYTRPHIIDFPKIGGSVQGYISVAENDNLPFEVKRIYWTYYTPESVERGGHAHYGLQQILLAVAGKIIVYVEMPDGSGEEFILEDPNKGLFIPKLWQHALDYVHDATYNYSLWNGEYPYNHVTAVDGALSAGSGMECFY